MALDELTAEEILDGVTGSTPLLEVIGGRGTASGVTGSAPRRRGPPPKYVLDERAKAVLATYDGSAASLNRITDELSVPRNKILDWLKELGLRNRAQPRGSVAQNPADVVTTATPVSAREHKPTAAATKATPQPTPAQDEAAPRIPLGEWLTSGAEGVWFAGSLCVQPLAEDPHSFAVLISHPAVPRVPGPVPGHLVEYLVRALVRKSNIAGVVYR